MQKAEVHVTMKTGQIKASPTESEIHPSHKPAVYAPGYFAIASSQTQLLAGAPGGSRVSSGLCSEDRSCGGPSPSKDPRKYASFLRRRWLFRTGSDPALQSSTEILLLIDHYGKSMCGRTCFAEIIPLHAAMILQKCQPLYLPGNGHIIVTASPKLALAKKG